MEEHTKPWNPLSVADASLLFSGAAFATWIAGGIALELAIGQPIRNDHSDIDLLLLRPDHMAARELLHNWDCWAADPPGTLREWPPGLTLSSAAHDIWCRKSPADKWRLQLMLDEAEGSYWVSRRDPTIRARIDDITRTTASGVTYLAPHIQLYYKAKNIRDKDQLDFDAVIDSGIEFDTQWLRNAISQTYGPKHLWLKRLSK